jgi:hypothetical protein
MTQPTGSTERPGWARAPVVIGALVVLAVIVVILIYALAGGGGGGSGGPGY